MASRGWNLHNFWPTLIIFSPVALLIARPLWHHCCNLKKITGLLPPTVCPGLLWQHSFLFNKSLSHLCLGLRWRHRRGRPAGGRSRDRWSGGRGRSPGGRSRGRESCEHCASHRRRPRRQAGWRWSARRDPVKHGLINHIDAKAKCRYLAKLTSKGIFRQMYINLRPSYDPIPIPLTHCIRVYTVHLFTQGMGGGGRGEPTKEKVRGTTVHTAGSKKCQHDWQYLQYIHSDKHQPQCHFARQLFKMTTFSFGVYIVN